MEKSRSRQQFVAVVIVYLIAVALNLFFFCEAFYRDNARMWLHAAVAVLLVAVGYLMATKWVDRVYPGHRRNRRPE